MHAFQRLAKGEGVRPAFGREPLRGQPASAPNIIREIEKLDMELSSLAHPVGSDPPGVNLALFGYEPAETDEYAARGGEIFLPPEMNYSLSLAFSAGTIGFCVINGVFYHNDSILPDGAHIVRIEPHRVLIQKGELLHWIPVTDNLKSQDEKEKETGERA